MQVSRMSRVAGLVVVMMVACAAMASASPCKGNSDLDCPNYTVVRELGNDIQLRRYEANSLWASTQVTGERSLDKASAVGFTRLFKYISGDNGLEQRIDMAAPVVELARLDHERQIREDVNVSFFLGHLSQVPPVPNDDRIEVQQIEEEREVYVLPFGLFALGFRSRRLALGLMDQLEAQGINDFDNTTFRVAVYDPPYKFWDRHNEIWLQRRTKKTTQQGLA